MIKAVAEAELSHFLYDCFIILGWILSIVYGMLFCSKYNMGKIKTLLSLIIFAVVNFFTIRLVCWALSGFQIWGGQNMIKAFVYFPLTSWIISKIFKINSTDFLDFGAPCHCITIAMAHMGCVFLGCCHGYECQFGIYNPQMQKILFPVQLLEAVVSLLVAFLVILYSKKNNYCVRGKAYPLMLMLFGYSRFFLEFLRDNQKLFLGISDLALHALFAGIVGTVWFIWLKWKEKNKKSEEEPTPNNV